MSTHGDVSGPVNAGAPAQEAKPYRFGDELRREWRLIFASLLGLSSGIATIGHPYSIGVMMEPLQRQFGWTALQVQGVQPFIAASVVAMAALVGWWIDLHRVRPVIVASHVTFGLGMCAIGLLTQSIFSFYALYTVAALFGGGMLAVSYMKLLVPRLQRERGLGMGIALLGSGVSSFVYTRILVRIVDAYGWRAGYVAIGLLVLFISLPVSWAWARDASRSSRTDDAPDAPNNASAGAAAGARADTAEPATGASFAAAIVSYRLWALFFAFILFSGSVTCVLNNFPPILGEKGYARTESVAIASWFGIALIVGRLAVGALIDRLWGPLVGAALFFASAAGIYLLSLQGFTQPAHVAFVVMAGLAAGAEVDLMSYLTSRYFGTRAFGRIYGTVYIGFALGPAPFVPLFAALRDRTGGFEQGLVWVAVGMIVSGLLLLSLGRYPAQFNPRA